MILERETERERNIDLLFCLFMHPLVDSYMCPDQGLNLQPWCMGTTLQPTELPGQGTMCTILKKTSLDSITLQNFCPFLCPPFSNISQKRALEVSVFPASRPSSCSHSIQAGVPAAPLGLLLSIAQKTSLSYNTSLLYNNIVFYQLANLTSQNYLVR